MKVKVKTYTRSIPHQSSGDNLLIKIWRTQGKQWGIQLTRHFYIEGSRKHYAPIIKPDSFRAANAVRSALGNFGAAHDAPTANEILQAAAHELGVVSDATTLSV